MNEEKLIKKCLISDDAVETYPFEDEKYGKLPIIRHESNGKWFAVIFRLENKLYVNLKCHPDLAAVLKDEEPAISAGWHMNKKHWIKVEVNKISSEALDKLIQISFDLTAPKKRHHKLK